MSTMSTGWNRSGSQPENAPKKPSSMRGIVAGIICAAGALAVFFYLTSGKEQSVEKKVVKKVAIQEVRHSVSNRVAVAKPSEEKKSEENESVLPPWKDEYIKDYNMRLKYSTLFKAWTNESGMITERLKLPNGKIWRRVIDPPPVFNNLSDNAIAMTMRNTFGVPSPPVPGLMDGNLDEAFEKSLQTPITINDDDTPGVAAIKLLVKETREEILRMRKEGDTRSVGEMLAEHIDLSNHHAAMRADAYTAIENERKEHGDEAAEIFREAINKSLEKYGVEGIPAITQDENADEEQSE